MYLKLALITFWEVLWNGIEECTSTKEFDNQELYRWITPGEFSFGPGGYYDSLQPVPIQYRQKDWTPEEALETHKCRTFLAETRKNAGMPPIYWMKNKN